VIPSRWQDRSWLPHEKDDDQEVRGIAHTNGGQILIRRIDAFQEGRLFGLADPENPQYNLRGEDLLAETYRAQGAHQALEVVKTWLLNEPEPTEESIDE
jgi:hypothetical protein